MTVQVDRSNIDRPIAGQRSGRLVEIDALRGLAALAVVLFHYTTRFSDLYSANQPPTIAFPYGHYGVNLFFIISGFVIFMTLDKTSKPMDFVVSRFSRLFPAYWVAIALTFMLTHLLGLPGKLVDLGAAIGNLMMIHHLLFGLPHVDSVYWTLEVELLFYAWMLGLFCLRGLDRLHYVLLGLLALRVANSVLEWKFGFGIPWTIARLMNLKAIPWFALGISVYLATSRHGPTAWRPPALVAGFSILTLALGDSLLIAGLAVVLASAVFLAANERLGLLRHRSFVWLGTISYPLYLLHENIGWSVQLRLQALGMSTDGTVLVAIAISVALATGMTIWVEQPAMRWIRARYRSRLVLAR
ncbi:acyltransferase [Accumulibacter sp.]|uniref:acyltransferase family protein n=1 Tax=Accumulibacter sp. TaxID=2053492 RepID=UPI00261112F4|nr:acyltransferase [Accumulibacter sp.]